MLSELPFHYRHGPPGYVNTLLQPPGILILILGQWHTWTGQGDTHVVFLSHDPTWFDYTKHFQTDPVLQNEDYLFYSDPNVNTF